MTVYTSASLGLHNEEPLPDCHMVGLVGYEFPVVDFVQGDFSIRVTVDDPGTYLRGWAGELLRLAEEYDAAQPVPFVPAAVES